MIFAPLTLLAPASAGGKLSAKDVKGLRKIIVSNNILCVLNVIGLNSF
jgi:hypothetical protein